MVYLKLLQFQDLTPRQELRERRVSFEVHLGYTLRATLAVPRFSYELPFLGLSDLLFCSKIKKSCLDNALLSHTFPQNSIWVGQHKSIIYIRVIVLPCRHFDRELRYEADFVLGMTRLSMSSKLRLWPHSQLSTAWLTVYRCSFLGLKKCC